MTQEAHAKAIEGGIQGWSIGAPYPYLVVAIDNPTGYPPGLYWYVVDTRRGSTDFHSRIGIATKGKLASLFATCHAQALYRHDILGETPTEASRAYDEYWDAVRDAGGAAHGVKSF